jgi:hypothetical protein
MNTPEIQSLWRQIDEWSRTAYETPASSWEEYQRRLGVYQGLRQAVDTLIALQNDGED